jgi:hypothetical protein
MIRLGTSGWELYPGPKCQDCQPYPGLRDRLWARLFFQQFTREPLADAAIRNLLSQQVRPWALTKMTADDAAAQMAALLSCGMWHVHAPSLPEAGGGAGSESEEEDIADIVQGPAVRNEPIVRPQSVEEEDALKKPNAETKTSGNRIDIKFDPSKSAKVKKCERIVHIQFVRTWADDKIIKRGDFLTLWKFHDHVTSDGGWSIDHLSGENTPDYQQGVGDGKKNGGVAKATMRDIPSNSGGDKGFYDPIANPAGWKKFVAEFDTFAYCMKGPDCGTWYEGMTWTYTKTWQDQRDGKLGISKVVKDTVTTGPTKSELAAFDKFNSAAKPPFKPCT